MANTTLSLLLSSSLILLFAVVLAIIGLATASWATGSDPSADTKYKIGVYIVQICPTSGDTSCTTYKLDATDCSISVGGTDEKLFTGDSCDRFQTARAFGIIAVILYALTLIFALSTLVTKRENTEAFVGLMYTFAAISGCITMAIIIALIRSNAAGDVISGFDYGYSFIVFTISWILSMAGGIIMLVASQMN